VIVIKIYEGSNLKHKGILNRCWKYQKSLNVFDSHQSFANKCLYNSF